MYYVCFVNYDDNDDDDDVVSVLLCSISWEMYPKLTSESVRQEQEELDIRTLHLLRATVHNEERKLPENWEENPAEHKKYESLGLSVSLRSIGQGCEGLKVKVTRVCRSRL